MKFLKKIASMSEAIQTNVDVLYATDTEVKFTKALPSVTYSVKNISSPSVDWTSTSTTISFTGVKTYSDGTVEETEETQIVTFEQNTPQGEGTPMQFTANTEFVDLGLPSGLKWAKCNLGAQSETEYGAYFSWGDTNGYARPTDKGGTSAARNITDKFLWNDVEVNYTVKQGGANGGFTWATEKWNGGAFYDATYFKSVSGQVMNSNKVLLAENDAAHVHMGGDWRMPTTEEFQELYDNTTKAWTGIGDKYGQKFTASNGNYIFIPAAGFCSKDSVYNMGSNAYVWSSSLSTSDPYYASSLYFDSRLVRPQYDRHDRYRGFSVRAVSKN